MQFLNIVYIVISLLGFAGFYYLMAIHKTSPQKQLGKNFRMPDERLHYTPHMLYNIYEEAGEDGRTLMRRYWLYDFGLIACLLGVMVAISSNIVNAQTWVFPLMIWLAVVRTLVDVLEDLLFLYLLKCFPEYHYSTARFTAGLTTTKHVLLIVWLILMFMMLFLMAFGIAQ